MKAAIAALALTVASAGLGVAAKLAPSAGRGPDAFGWFAARGLVEIEPSRAVGGAEGHRLHLLGTADSAACRLQVILLDSPEEIIPALQRDIPPAAWSRVHLWFGTLEPGLPSATALHLRRVTMRLRDGAAPLPALVLPAPGCDGLLSP